MRAAFHLRAAGFYSLGLLALILTPFIRVLGSIVAFAAARDWRFVAVTSAVLVRDAREHRHRRRLRRWVARRGQERSARRLRYAHLT